MQKKKCKNHSACGNTFIQYSTTQNLCFECQKEKQNAKKIVKKRMRGVERSLKRRGGKTDEQKARDRCDHLWSHVVKRAKPFCWFPSCNRRSEEACHVNSRRHDATRWNIDNGMGGCKQHHRWETDHPKDAKPLVMDFIGKKKYEKLRVLAGTTAHYCLQDYLEIEKRLKKSLKYYLRNS